MDTNYLQDEASAEALNEQQLQQMIGFSIKREVFNERGVVIIPAHSSLQVEHLPFLAKHRIRLYRRDFEQQIKQTSEALVTHASEHMREMFEWMRKDKPIPIEQMNGTIIPAIYQAADFPSLHSVMSGLQAKDDYTYRHNIGVGVIATLIGKWLHVDEEDLSMLSMAALLHDIGKIRITDEILNKPGKFTDDEYQEMKNHTLYGYDIIKQTPNISNRLALVALQHHEREDGRGYPFGIRSHQIDYFSKIVGVADIFHAMTSKRVYKEATPFYIVIKQMQEDSFGQMDQSICNLFIRRLMEMAVGDEVILTDNRRGVIVSVNPFDIIKPLIRIGNDFVDLNLEGDLHIHSIAG